MYVQPSHSQALHPGPDPSPPSSVQTHVYLRNKEWNTRIAAGQAIEAIANAIPVWNPTLPTEPVVKEDPTLQEQESLAEIGRFNFETFDPLAILKNGKLLLSSTGTEFVIARAEMMDPRALALQRKNIKEQLGEGFQFMGEIANDEDLMAVDSAPVKTEYVLQTLISTIALLYLIFVPSFFVFVPISLGKCHPRLRRSAQSSRRCFPRRELVPDRRIKPDAN